mmetsp:Transcript_84368/g.146455  ORF Transcript_84368/g.146455 Transcript_84368/m.146455 type:complete len:288 (+) Transcript_84368:80-943(+)
MNLNAPPDASEKFFPKDAAAVFRERLTRKFGNAVRAWRVIDPQRQGMLTKAEFFSSLKVTGYGGGPNVLWAALGCKKTISLKELDPEAFAILKKFRGKCLRKFGSLERLFEDAHGGNAARLSYSDFVRICMEVGGPKPYDRLFDFLDINGHGSVTWEEARFLEEGWDWKRQTAYRSSPSPMGRGRNSLDMPARVEGEGPLCSEYKPRRVELVKSNSLPDIVPRLRPKFNDRHHVMDWMSDSTTQLVHLVTAVQTEEQERIRKRVIQAIRDVPTDQWLNQNMDFDEEY